MEVTIMSIFEVHLRRDATHGADAGNVDPFVARYRALPKRPSTRAVGNFPALLGDYESWKSFIADAVDQDARPSPELIKANWMLAAWETHLRIAKVSSFPVSVGVGVTDVCNARCSFCAYVPERVANRKMTLEQFERADWLKFSRNFRPNGSGLGEPFAHSQIAEILAAIRRNAPFIWMDSITNGSLLRGKVLDAIVAFVQYLYVSVNAARAETYEKTMRPLKWDTLMRNLEDLKAAKARAGTDLPRLRAGYVCHVHNLEEVLELPRLLKSLGFEELNVNQMLVPPQFSSADVPLMDIRDSIHTIPERADRVFRALEIEMRQQGLKLMKPLPSLKVLRSQIAEAGA
jgi:wyosine [tRNA(Phe)-imidazoG37] synthetase (radical SAM superfamily)